MSILVQDAASSNTTYNQLRSEGFRTSYVGATHSDITKDTLTLNSNPPKRSGSSFGNRRSSINLVRTVSVSTPDNLTEIKDMKFELVCSILVGVAQSEIDEAIARIASLAANTSVVNSVAVAGKTQL